MKRDYSGTLASGGTDANRAYGNVVYKTVPRTSEPNGHRAVSLQRSTRPAPSVALRRTQLVAA